MEWIRDSVYKPISAYGVVGDTRTAALIGQDGSIDWCCFPRFDSPSCFAALIDAAGGGFFRIQPVRAYTSSQRYYPLTNILVTSFHLRDGSGILELLDFMPSPGETAIADPHELHRRMRCLRGEVEVVVDFRPRFDYARALTRVQLCEHGVFASGAAESLLLTGTSHIVWEIADADSAASARPIIKPAHDQWLLLRWGVDASEPATADHCKRALHDTAAFWNGWAAHLTYDGLYRAEV
jgi:GH15 family glucan-1,4-alpha-glucosidase